MTRATLRWCALLWALPGTRALRAALRRDHWDSQLLDIVAATATCCSSIAARLATLPLAEQAQAGATNAQGEAQKPMDVWSDELMTDALRPLAASLASEEREAAVRGAEGAAYSVAFDPLDGSSNLDVSLPTGTIFGVFRGDAFVGRTARESLVASGYARGGNQTARCLQGACALCSVERACSARVRSDKWSVTAQATRSTAAAASSSSRGRAGHSAGSSSTAARSSRRLPS